MTPLEQLANNPCAWVLLGMIIVPAVKFFTRRRRERAEYRAWHFEELAR